MQGMRSPVTLGNGAWSCGWALVRARRPGHRIGRAAVRLSQHLSGACVADKWIR